VICSKPAEMHHLKHVRQRLCHKKPGTFYAYLEVMRMVNRKTLPVCRKHHLEIHRGSLKQLFAAFNEQEVGFKMAKAKALIKEVEKKETKNG
jgi:hypothetical protein